MQRRILGALLVSGVIGLGCGSDGGGPTGPGNTNDGGTGFTARIDGSAWSSNANTIQVTGNPSNPGPGQLIISGIEAGTGRGIQLILSYIDGPGSYPFGVNFLTTPGGTASVIIAPNSWLTPFSGAAGSVEITARTATRIAGTFAFTADAIAGATPPQRGVTNGAFDITVSTGLPALPTQPGSTMSGTLGGSAWNAATIVASSPAAGLFSLSGNSTEYTITASPKQPVVAGNSYGIPSQMSFTVIRTGTADSWAATSGPDIGTWTVDSFTSEGMSGSFQGTIPGLSVGTSLTIAGGTYSLEFL